MSKKMPMATEERNAGGDSLRWKWTLWIVILWAGFVAASVAACGAGFLRPEAFTFLPHYLQHRPWYEIVFDTAGTDSSAYHARELGHALTYLDSRFILESVLAGHPHFFSVTHYVLLLGCGWGAFKANQTPAAADAPKKPDAPFSIEEPEPAAAKDPNRGDYVVGAVIWAWRLS